MFEDLKVSDHIISDIESAYNNPSLLEDIDYSEAVKIMREKAEYAVQWLKNALNTNNSDEKFYHLENYMELKLKESGTRIPQTDTAKEKKHETEILLFQNEIYKKYYYCKIKSKLMIKKSTKEHYKYKADKLHEKVRLIRKLKKEYMNV